MLGSDVREVLREKNIHEVYHANTVTTSCTFLQQGGLASRGYVADRGLPQTPQTSDGTDQKYGIWHDVFVDSDDYHNRIRSHNFYGPVLFALGSNALAELPSGSTVLVTKKNPTKWKDGEPHAERFFSGMDELSDGLEKGTFDQMIVIRTPKKILRFAGQANVVLDDPQQRLSNGVDAFTWASKRLKDAAKASGITLQIHRRTCRAGCRCLENYGRLDLDFYFG